MEKKDSTDESKYTDLNDWLGDRYPDTQAKDSLVASMITLYKTCVQVVGGVEELVSLAFVEVVERQGVLVCFESLWRREVFGVAGRAGNTQFGDQTTQGMPTLGEVGASNGGCSELVIGMTRRDDLRHCSAADLAHGILTFHPVDEDLQCLAVIDTGNVLQRLRDVAAGIDAIVIQLRGSDADGPDESVAI